MKLQKQKPKEVAPYLVGPIPFYALCAYQDTLEIITPISKVSEAEVLMPNKVAPLLSKTISNHDDSIEGDHDDEMLSRHLASFHTVDD